jgi:RNA polymerase sigma-70 factor (sigma-E family)
MTSHRDAEFAEYMSARLPSLRRLALLLCQDWHQADDLVQAAMTKLYLHWYRAAGADNIEAYVRSIVVREFLRERRTAWARRVSLADQVPEAPAPTGDHDGALDLQTAVAALPPRQRAVLVLRFYCDVNVEQCAHVLGCTPGTVKSQTAKALATLRHSLDREPQSGDAGAPEATRHPPRGIPDHA